VGAYHEGACVTSGRLGPFGKGIYELVSQLPADAKEELLNRRGYGLLVRLDSEGLPEAALVFDPDRPECRRLLHYSRLAGERLA
jgi:hypothetical protein